MSIEIKAPTFPESVQEGSIATWHKQPGETVFRDDLLVDIETDKVVLEVVAPTDGILAKTLKEEGAIVLSNEVIALINEGAAAASVVEVKEEPVENNGQEKTASPSARKLASEQNVDLQAVTGSGKDGRITKEDVAHVGGSGIPEVQADSRTTASSSISIPVGDRIEKRVPMTRMRARIADRLLQVTQTTAMLTTFNEVDMHKIMDLRSEFKDEFSKIVENNGQEKTASPSARKLASEQNVDLQAVTGSGKDGRITKEDVAHVGGSGIPEVQADSRTTASSSISIPVGDRIEKRVPMTRMRARIADRLLQVTQTTAMLTTFNEVDMHKIMDLRSEFKDEFSKIHPGARLGFMGFFVRAATEALKRFPSVNASIDGSDVIYHGYQDIGVAVSTEKGLVVPVLRNAENMSIADVERTIAELGAKARDGKLTMEEMTGGTFTITNGGVFGSLLSTPILNPPQAAILGMHSIKERPVAENGSVVIRPMMNLALSYDHRIIDGREAVSFLVAIKEMIENPAKILLEI